MHTNSFFCRLFSWIMPWCNECHCWHFLRAQRKCFQYLWSILLGAKTFISRFVDFCLIPLIKTSTYWIHISLIFPITVKSISDRRLVSQTWTPNAQTHLKTCPYSLDSKIFENSTWKQKLARTASSCCFECAVSGIGICVKRIVTLPSPHLESYMR